jgi:hypothetical protein
MAVSGTPDDELAAIEAAAISYLTAFNRADAAAVVANDLRYQGSRPDER